MMLSLLHLPANASKARLQTQAQRMESAFDAITAKIFDLYD